MSDPIEEMKAHNKTFRNYLLSLLAEDGDEEGEAQDIPGATSNPPPSNSGTGILHLNDDAGIAAFIKGSMNQSGE